MCVLHACVWVVYLKNIIIIIIINNIIVMCVFSFCLLGGFFFFLFLSSSSNSSDLLYTHLCTQFMLLPFDMGCFYCEKGTGNKNK